MNSDFPREIISSNAESLSEFVVANKKFILSEIDAHGAVVLREFANSSVVEFAKVARALGAPISDMACSAGPRIEVIPGVHTANEAPPTESIPFHHEMAQCSSPPKYVLFFCDTAPAQGGATPIIHSWKLADELKRSHPDVADRIRDRQIQYARELPSTTDMTSPLGKSWKHTLCVDNKKDAENVLHSQGFRWEWLSCDRLRTIGPTVPMFRAHKGHDILFTAAETVFLGGAHQRQGRPEKSFIYGNGEPLDAETIDAFVSLGHYAFEHSAKVTWRKGDVLIIDNAAVMHARETFTPPRRILVSLVGCIDGESVFEE